MARGRLARSGNEKLFGRRLDFFGQVGVQQGGGNKFSSRYLKEKEKSPAGSRAEPSVSKLTPDKFLLTEATEPILGHGVRLHAGRQF